MSNGMNVFSIDLDPMMKATPGFISAQFENLKKVGAYMIEDHELKHQLALSLVDKGKQKIDSIVFEVQPNGSISTAASSNIAVFNMPNGMPALQAIGPNKTMMSWQGLFYDKTGLQNNQFDNAKLIEGWQNECQVLKLVFGPMVRNVIIQNFQYDYKRIDLIQYSISVIVDDSQDVRNWLNSYNINPETLLGGPDSPLTKMFNTYTTVTGGFANKAENLYNEVNNVKNNVSSISRQYGSLAYAPLANLSEALIQTSKANQSAKKLSLDINNNSNYKRFREGLGVIQL